MLARLNHNNLNDPLVPDDESNPNSSGEIIARKTPKRKR